jgi:hypothetical protein
LVSAHKFSHHFFYIRVARACPDFLKSFFNSFVLLHLSLHLFLEKLSPYFLHQVFILVFDFSLISVLVRCFFSDFLLP